MNKNISTITKIALVVLTLSLGASYAFAWTPPGATPPGGNVDAPLNTSVNNQTKTGGLLTLLNEWINGALGVTGGATFGGNVGVGTATPANPLTVVQTTAYPASGIQMTSSIADPNIAITNTSAAGRDWRLISAGTGSGAASKLRIYDATAGLDRMVVDSTGNVGVGTVAPTYKFTIGTGNAAFGVENTATFLAKNAGGAYEAYLWPRWSDNATYLNYGVGGLNIRNNASALTMSMNNAGNVNATGSITATGGFVGNASTATNLQPGGTAGQVLTSNGAVAPTWQAPAGLSGGLANYITKWLTPTSIGNSQVFDNGTNVGIGTAAPTAQFQLWNTTHGGDLGLGQQNDVTPYMRLGMDTSWNQYIANNAYWNGTQFNHVNTGGYGGLASAIRQVGGKISFDTASGTTDPITWVNRLNINNDGTIVAPGTVTSTGGFVGNLSGVASSANLVNGPDGDRNAATKLPTSNPRAVRFDFVGAASTGTGGNYAGLMTYAPWTGTTASTGDASYQLAFGSTAVNATGVPKLRVRNGIDSTWNGWKNIITDDGAGNIAATSFTGSLAGNATTANNLAPGGTAGQVLTSNGAVAPSWQNAAGGGITGSGTLNYVSKWTSATAQGNSLIFDNGTNVGIGTAAPLSKLSVGGAGESGNGINSTGSVGIKGIGTGATTLSGASIGTYDFGSAASTTAVGLNGLGANFGVMGKNTSGVIGGSGVYGEGKYLGVLGFGQIGVYGVGPNANPGYGYGMGTIGVRGDSGPGGIGVMGAVAASGFSGVYAMGGPTGVWSYGTTNDFLGANGEKTVGGVWTNGSDRNIKENFKNVDNMTILRKILELPITEWNYKTVKDAKHIGPVAQDFSAIFGLGNDNISISTIDPAGIALVGIKALNEKIETQQKEINKLKSDNDALLMRLERIEAKLK